MPPRVAVMQPSHVYYTTNLVWIVPPGKPQSALGKLSNPLDYIVWVFSLLTIVIGFMTIALIKMQPLTIQKFVFGKYTQSPGLNFINIILGSSIRPVPLRNFSRFLFIVATLYFFIVRTCYSGGLVKFMQMDTRGQHMMTTSQMIDANFKFYLKNTSFHYVQDMPEVVKKTVLVPVSVFNLKLQDVIKDPYYNGAFLTTTAHLAYRNMKVYPNNFHEFAPEPVYRVNIVIYMGIGSCLKSYFNKMLLNLLSNGLIDKYASIFIDSRYLKKPVDENLESLSLDQLEGAFQLLVGGLLVGFAVFCGEVLVGMDIAKKFRKLNILRTRQKYKN